MLWPLHYYYNRHPINLVMLGVCTISISLTIGLACALTSGMYGFIYLFIFFFCCKFMIIPEALENRRVEEGNPVLLSVIIG